MGSPIAPKSYCPPRLSWCSWESVGINPAVPVHRCSWAALGLHYPMHSVLLTIPVNFINSLPWPQREEPGWRGAVEQKGTGFVPLPSPGAVQTGLPVLMLPQPSLLAQCLPVWGESRPLGACEHPVPCGACCSAGAGCWPPATWQVLRAAAGTSAAQAGTTPAGPQAAIRHAATATRTARGQVTAVRTTVLCAAMPWWAVRWGPGGGGAGAAPCVGLAARPAAARSPSRPGTEESPVPTSSSAVAAWASTQPVRQPKKWPRYYLTPSARTSGIPGGEMGSCCRRNCLGKAPLPWAGLDPPAAPGQAGVCQVPGRNIPPPSSLHRTWAARSQDILGGCFRGRVPGLVGAGGAAGGLCLPPTSSHLCVVSPKEGLPLTRGADSPCFPLSILLKNGKKTLLIKIKNKGIAKVW